MGSSGKPKANKRSKKEAPIEEAFRRLDGLPASSDLDNAR